MSSEGADTRKLEENLTIFESLVFQQFGDAYRSFIRDSPITDRLERMSEFIELNFGLSNGIDYRRFTAEARRQIPANFIIPGQVHFLNKDVNSQNAFETRKGIESSNLQPLKRKWMATYFSSLKNVNDVGGCVNEEVASLGLEKADGCTAMSDEPLPLPDPPKLIDEGMGYNSDVFSSIVNEFFPNLNTLDVAEKASAEDPRSPQASTPPSKEFLKPCPVGAPKNNEKQASGDQLINREPRSYTTTIYKTISHDSTNPEVNMVIFTVSPPSPFMDNLIHLPMNTKIRENLNDGWKNYSTYVTPEFGTQIVDIIFRDTASILHHVNLMSRKSLLGLYAILWHMGLRPNGHSRVNDILARRSN